MSDFMGGDRSQYARFVHPKVVMCACDAIKEDICVPSITIFSEKGVPEDGLADRLSFRDDAQHQFLASRHTLTCRTLNSFCAVDPHQFDSRGAKDARGFKSGLLQQAG